MKWSLRLLTLACLLLGLRGLGVAWTVLTQLELYRAVDAAGPWWLRASLYALWGMIFLVLAGGLLRRKAWAIRWLMPALIGFTLFDLGWLAIYAQAVYDRGRLGFAAVTSGLLLCLAYWLTTRVRRFFGD